MTAPAPRVCACVDTADTIRNMVRYIASDEKIAKHVGVSVELVAVARKRQERRRPDFPSYQSHKAQDGAGPDDRWMAKARVASGKLGLALAKLNS